MDDFKYITVMFPYPSGSGLHCGHWYNYAVMDSYCRYQRFIGHKVFQPFGYDAFGLPAENYARKIGGDPRDITYQNIEKFREQMKNMNTEYEELLVTSDNDYQYMTQKIFALLRDTGMAYKKNGEVDYCGGCETVLAREQVKNGKCDRCDSEVTKKTLNQWYLRLSNYAERLHNNLSIIDYPKSTVNAQREWIGRSEGYEVCFGNGIVVFTTKPETILDVRFIVKAGENAFTGEYAVNPVNGESIPIYTADYVVDGYGTGYVMGVPNDDKRDRAFAEKMGIGFDMQKNLIDDVSFANKKVNYKLHDWCISRQRKWGCPIPMEGETDTMDTFVDSSFYFIAYCVWKGIKPRPVDLYVGGKEHACMHLIYARFMTMFLFDQGLIDFEEPFKKVIHQGMILNEGEKMSKSKNNVVSLDGYDSDEIRFYLMFIGHYFDGGSWSDKNINGIRRFVGKFKEWMSRTGGSEIDIQKFKQTIFAFTDSFKFNKVVSSFMILVNDNKNLSLTKENKDQLISLLKIYMPSIEEKL